MTNLNSETMPIGKLFGDGKFFAIPDYQRPFSWDRDQISDLIEDLINAKQDSDYFLGTLVLHEVTPGNHDVVDGQQRLTALSLLLACLRDRLEQDNEEIQELLVQPKKTFQDIPERARLTVRDSGPYNKIVSEVNGTLDVDEIDTLTTSTDRRYRSAVTVFRDRISNLSQSNLANLAKFIIQHVVVIYLSASSFEDAFRLFTVVNDRGKQLRRIDVLKADNLSPDVMHNKNIREEYARKWENYEESLGESHFESLFHALRLIYVQDKPEGDLLHEFTERIFPRPEGPDRGSSFVDLLGDYVELYDAIFITRDYLSGTDSHVKFKTLMHSMVKEFKASEWKACVLLFAKKFKSDNLLDFIYEVERMFVDHWVQGIRKDERYSAYTALLKRIHGAKNPSKVLGSTDVTLANIAEACKIKSFYGAGYSKYLLVRTEIQTAELTDAKEFNPVSVEHVLPQTIKTGSGWEAAFSPEVSAELVHTAGNLVLLSKGKNSSAQNKEFVAKKQTYLGPRVSDFPRSLQVLAVDDWTPAVIRQRTEEFAQNILAPL